MIDIGFTGTRHGMNDAQKMALGRLLAAFPRPAWLHHGLCVGADAEAHEIALAMDMLIEGHPPSNQRLAMPRPWLGFAQINLPLPYLVRNSRIVDKTSELIAAPRNEAIGGGTWSTIHYAKGAGRKVTIIYAHGAVEVFP